jgi:hypothetical protein
MLPSVINELTLREQFILVSTQPFSVQSASVLIDVVRSRHGCRNVHFLPYTPFAFHQRLRRAVRVA